MNRDEQIYIQNEEGFTGGRVVDISMPITVNIAHTEHLDESGDVSHAYEIDCFRGSAEVPCTHVLFDITKLGKNPEKYNNSVIYFGKNLQPGRGRKRPRG